MNRHELRESIFKIVFQIPFYGAENMQEQTEVDIESLKLLAEEPLSEEDYHKLLTWALTKVSLPVNVPDALTQLTAETVSKSDGIEYLLLYAVSPIVNDFTKDPPPSDVNVTLPGYGYEENETFSLLKKIRKYFEMLLAFLHALFSFLY